VLETITCRFSSYVVYTFAVVLLRHFPVHHFPVLQILPLRLCPSFSSPANSSHPFFAAGSISNSQYLQLNAKTTTVHYLVVMTVRLDLTRVTFIREKHKSITATKKVCNVEYASGEAI